MDLKTRAKFRDESRATKRRIEAEAMVAMFLPEAGSARDFIWAITFLDNTEEDDLPSNVDEASEVADAILEYMSKQGKQEDSSNE